MSLKLQRKIVFVRSRDQPVLNANVNDQHHIKRQYRQRVDIFNNSIALQDVIRLGISLSTKKIENLYKAKKILKVHPMYLTTMDTNWLKDYRRGITPYITIHFLTERGKYATFKINFLKYFFLNNGNIGKTRSRILSLLLLGSSRINKMDVSRLRIPVDMRYVDKNGKNITRILEKSRLRKAVADTSFCKCYKWFFPEIYPGEDHHRLTNLQLGSCLRFSTVMSLPGDNDVAYMATTGSGVAYNYNNFYMFRNKTFMNMVGFEPIYEGQSTWEVIGNRMHRSGRYVNHRPHVCELVRHIPLSLQVNDFQLELYDDLWMQETLAQCPRSIDTSYVTDEVKQQVENSQECKVQ